MNGYSNIYKEKLKQNKNIPLNNVLKSTKKEKELFVKNQNNINHKENIIKFDNLSESLVKNEIYKNSLIKVFHEKDNYSSNFNQNNKDDELKPTISFINKNINNLNHNSNIYLKRYYNLEENRRLKNIFDNINPNKEIIYNFGYEKKDRLEPLKLSLIEDSINIKEDEIKLKRKEKKEDLKKQKEKKNLNFDIKKINNDNKKNKISKINLKDKNNDEYLYKAVEQELNLTNSQMNNLAKEANIIYNKFLKKKNQSLNINYSRNNNFLSRQGINIIQKSENNKFRNGLNYHKQNISISKPLLIKNKNFFSPQVKKDFNFFQKHNNYDCIKKRKIFKNYSDIF